ncbi:hypothetical protein A6A08_02490 [Nocardiopsis sp. TSRI0078]|nr:hypothetical protein A6A08_02490 [Nocardiopsis sp. TSRI0078]
MTRNRDREIHAEEGSGPVVLRFHDRSAVAMTLGPEPAPRLRFAAVGPGRARRGCYAAGNGVPGESPSDDQRVIDL